MIQNVVFDMGNVLYGFDYHRAYEPLASHLDMDFETFGREIVDGHPKSRCDAGEITPHTLYTSIVGDFGLRCDYPTFAAAWQSIFTEVPAMVDFAISLRRSFGVYLLSTTDELHMEQQKNRTRLLEVTTNLGLSYELGSVKPDRGIYVRFLKKFSLEGSSCVFIDDLEENARGAEQVGMAWIHHRSPEDTISRLAEMGVE